MILRGVDESAESFDGAVEVDDDKTDVMVGADVLVGLREVELARGVLEKACTLLGC